jgi:hypothetical protein
VKFIPRGTAVVRVKDDTNQVQCASILKKKMADLLVGDGLLVARYDALRMVDGKEQNIVQEEIIHADFNIILDPAVSPYAADWPQPAVPKPSRSYAARTPQVKDTPKG